MVFILIKRTHIKIALNLVIRSKLFHNYKTSPVNTTHIWGKISSVSSHHFFSDSKYLPFLKKVELYCIELIIFNVRATVRS